MAPKFWSIPPAPRPLDDAPLLSWDNMVLLWHGVLWDHPLSIAKGMLWTPVPKTFTGVEKSIILFLKES